MVCCLYVHACVCVCVCVWGGGLGGWVGMGVVLCDKSECCMTALLIYYLHSLLQEMHNSRMQQWNQLSSTLQMPFRHDKLHDHLWTPSYLHAPLRPRKVHIAFHIIWAYWLRTFVACRSTIYTQYSVLKELHLSLGNVNFPSTITYNHFRLAWYCYMKKLDINYEDGFCCPKCGNQPQAVVMDATSLAFRKELDSWELVLKVPKSKERSGR